MVSLEENIDTFAKETKESVDILIAGSDEHLDLILSVTRPLNRISEKFELLNEALHRDINSYPLAGIKSNLLPKLKNINKDCLTIIGAIRTSILYRDVRESLKKFSRQYELLRELIFDLHHYRTSNDAELDNLLGEINDL